MAWAVEAATRPAEVDDLRAGVDGLRAEVAMFRAEMREFIGWGRAVAAVADLEQLARGAHPISESLAILTTNFELLKGEIRSIEAEIQESEKALRDLAFAIAPGAGLPGVAARFAEVRERLNALDRRMRVAAEMQAAPRADQHAGTPEHMDQPRSSGFDYVGFELRFRGDPATVASSLRDRYFDVLAGNGPVLDIGCGRGELLTELAAVGIEGLGVDIDPGMVAEARAAGVDARLGDAIQFLRDSPEEQFGAICAIHVVEHLELPALVEMLELSVSRLKPGGILIAETPNPTTLLVLGNSYILDPTHVWPLHPSLLTFLCESAGFRDVRQRFFSPAEDYQLQLLDEAVEPWVEVVNKSLARLNDVLFGFQDYAVVAKTPGA
jgi:2-polyprenyl-3-methyl-5-hydroxy-6-metoxy-1,4-benzoquinol methylase